MSSNSVCNHTRDFVNHSYDYRPNWTPLSVLLPLLITLRVVYYNRPSTRAAYVLTFFLRIWPPLVMSDLSVWSYRMYTLHARQYRNTLPKEDYAVFPWFHAAIFRGFRVQRGLFQVDASWGSEMSFRPFKRACLTAWSEFLLICFIPFDWHWIDILSEFSKLLMKN